MIAGAMLSWTVCGLIVGLVARFLVPGREDLTLVMAIVLGTLGALVGGFLSWGLEGVPGEPCAPAGNAWQRRVMAILGAVLVLWVYRIL